MEKSTPSESKTDRNKGKQLSTEVLTAVLMTGVTPREPGETLEIQ